MTLALLHPIGLDGGSWDVFPMKLPAPAMRVTMLGHGPRAHGAPPRLSLSVLADDVVGHTDGPIDLIGVSMGATVAIEAALRWPERVRSLLVTGSSAGRHGGRRLEERAQLVERSGMAEVLSDTLNRWFSAQALGDDCHPGVVYARRTLLAVEPSWFAAAWRALAMSDLWGRLDRLAVPTTVVHAEDDASVSIADSWAVSDRILGSRRVVVPGPHLAYLERPKEFIAAVVEHLDWVRSRSAPAGADPLEQQSRS